MVHVFHVVAPEQYTTFGSDLGIGKPIENEEENARRTVSLMHAFLLGCLDTDACAVFLKHGII